MRFAQKQILLRDGSPGIRGTLRDLDVAEYAEAVEDSWDASFVQLTGGRLDARLDYLAGDRFVLYRESWSERLHTVGGPRPGVIAFGIPEARDTPGRWWGRPLPAGRVPFGRSDCELDLVSEPEEAVLVLAMDEDDFRALFSSLAGLDPSEFPTAGNLLAASPAAVERLRSSWKDILAGSTNGRACPASIADVVAPLSDAVELSRRIERSHAKKRSLVDAVMEVAEAGDFLASVPDLSARLRVSRRTIEYAFRECLGESPRAYFAKRRLSCCYRALSNAAPAETTVTSVALQHGFSELGRFASTYRHHFGELPSATLRRSRDSIPVRLGFGNGTAIPRKPRSSATAYRSR